MIGVGITGHRRDRIGSEQLGNVRAQLRHVLDAIDAATALPARLVCSLADGADSIAAEEALARGWPLDVVLPFSRGSCEADRQPEDREAFRNTLAAARDVFEFPQDREQDRAQGGDGAAHERAGRVVLGQCDILVAVWDGGPARGRGGAPQIVELAVAEGIPVVVIAPNSDAEPQLLWDGLTEHDLGRETVETVPRGSLAQLAVVLAAVAADDMLAVPPPSRRAGRGLAYPLLLMVLGVRRLRREDFFPAATTASLGDSVALCGSSGADGFAARLLTHVAPAFAEADAEATATARAFRSSYVSNFALAALAVVLALAGLIVPYALKPAIIVAELVTIATILLQTRAGNRSRLHTRWLDNRDCAERLRCLVLGAQLGDLDLRAAADTSSPWVTARVRTTARRLGLPPMVADDAYLGCVRTAFRSLLDEQIDYFEREAATMHRLDHRLHLLGTCAFAATAGVCIIVFMLKWLGLFHMIDSKGLPPTLFLVTTMLSAALPAIGAAIYGIRMQGDFAGIAERDSGLSAKLRALRNVDASDTLCFDTLSQRIARVTQLLTEDRTRWRQIYHARPLSLPG